METLRTVAVDGIGHYVDEGGRRAPILYTKPISAIILIDLRDNEGRFFKYVKVPLDEAKTATECWEWIGPDTNGYGKFSLKGEVYLAHRLSYALVHGPVINGLAVRHMCHNTYCVNPYHLAAGTPKDNVNDNRYIDASGITEGLDGSSFAVSEQYEDELEYT